MSASGSARVAFLWHMHQPWYADPRDGRRMVLPWTRLHALKDYLDMIAVAREHPAIRLTFNLVPSLLAQWREYAEGRAVDREWELSRRPAADLTGPEREWWLANGFRCHQPRILEPHRRYRELRDKRALGRYKDADFLDLQVWFNLAWCGAALRADPLVRELLTKGRGFTEDEKQALLDRLETALASVAPQYVQAAGDGQIEITTSPFYHPILPLLCHYADVRAALPGVALPTGVMDVPEDAAAQLARARSLCEEVLGFAPDGLWPSEGSLSEAALEQIAAAGFRWAATDEQILAHSLARAGRALRRGDLFRPYVCRGVHLFFRELRLSDKIGFEYASQPAAAAVADFIACLERCARDATVENPVIAVILDGENCWEYYPNNGHDFLSGLYAALERHPRLTTATFSECLADGPEPAPLETLFPGSWINHDFYIWAGHREDQRAWELLFRTRRALVDASSRLDEATRAAAWEHLYIAEGSDWFWWYGDDHSSGDDATFDALFRGHLQRIWELLGEEPPAVLAEPICGLPAASPLTPPAAPFTPVLDGRETGFFEWRAAGRLEGRGPAGAMSRGGESLLQAVRYGFDDTHLYLALTVAQPSDGHAVVFEWSGAGNLLRLTVDLAAGRREVRLEDGPDAPTALVVAGRIVEVALPLAALPAAPGETAELVVTVRRDGEPIDRWPARGAYAMPIPAPDDWLRDWIV